jgi:hypothetical protein
MLTRVNNNIPPTIRYEIKERFDEFVFDTVFFFLKGYLQLTKIDDGYCISIYP